MVPLRGPPVLLSFRHGASFPFRSVPPVPPPAPPARRTLYRAYPARARAGVSAGAVRAPDCPRARQAQGAPLPPAESGSSGLRAGAGGRRSMDAASSGPILSRVFAAWTRKRETLPEFNEHPVATLHRPGFAPAGPALPRAAPIRHPGPRAGVHPRLPMPPQPVESWSDCRGCRENRRWPPAFERVKKSDLSGFTLAVRTHPVTPDLIRGPSLTGCASRSRSRGNRTVGACPGPRSGARRESRRWTPDQVRGDDVYLSSSPFDTPAPSPSAPARRAVCCAYATVPRFFSCGGKKACALAGPGYASFSLW